MEGWCLGFKSVCDEHLEANIRQINQYLKDYETKLVSLDLEYLEAWRWEQEETMRKKAGDESIGMNKPEVKTFLARFKQVYRLYLQNLIDRPIVSDSQSLQIWIDGDRHICK